MTAPRPKIPPQYDVQLALQGNIFLSFVRDLADWEIPVSLAGDPNRYEAATPEQITERALELAQRSIRIMMDNGWIQPAPPASLAGLFDVPLDS